jgi:hypothetical protein
VRAFDSAGNVSAWSELVTATFEVNPFVVYLPLVMRDYAPPPPPAPNCRELVTNGGFETPDYFWYSLSSIKPTPVYSPGGIVHDGLISLLVGYTTTEGVPTTTVYSSIQQTVTIPLTATQTTLTFWRYPISTDTRDYQYVAIGPSPASATMTIWSRASNEQAWTLTTVDLSAYSSTLTIRLGTVNKDGADGGVTAMYLDDVSVQTCSP